MLVLSRKVGEKVVVGDEVVIEVVELNGGRARIGIQAPRHVHIVRGELLCQAKGGPEGGRPPVPRPTAS